MTELAYAALLPDHFLRSSRAVEAVAARAASEPGVTRACKRAHGRVTWLERRKQYKEPTLQ